MDLDDLLTISDIAAILGVSRQRADRITTNPGHQFPPPAGTKHGARMWHRVAVVEWDRTRTRRPPGRPKVSK